MDSPRNRALCSLSLCAVLAAGACARTPRGIDERLIVLDSGAPVLLGAGHKGPPAVAGPEATQRFVPALHARFERERALERTRFVDGFYRAPANDGFEATLERIESDLRAAGYGSEPGFALEWLEQPLAGRSDGSGERAPRRAWTPLSGRVALRDAKGERVLHEFDSPSGRDRTLLPVNAPSCDVEGPLALAFEELEPGEVLATDAPPSGDLLARARERGAVALLSANLEDYNTDPSGAQRHLDAIQYRQVSARNELPVAMISPRSLVALREARARDASARVSLRAQVRFDTRPLRTLCATVLGIDRAYEAVAIASHVQEPGACDNASGVAGIAECAIALAGALREGVLQRPSRSVVFLFGDEFTQSSMWLDATQRKPVAGISADMIGQSSERTGATALLERLPDPGAVKPLAPDAHTAWGGRPVAAERLAPNGLTVIARCALLDVAALEGSWTTAEHPYEGGSDHSEFLSRGIPGVLFWHFTDFAYHTSLDRIEHVDADELRRMSVAVLATALAVADPRPADLDRYLRTNNEERKLRVKAAEDSGDAELAELWRKWTDGARQWLRVETLRIPPDEIEDAR